MFLQQCISIFGNLFGGLLSISSCSSGRKKYNMCENKIVRDYRDDKVTKEELDKCSTCDMCATINEGLSVESREQLREQTGEEIVDADIARQMKA